jgi:hypothetical protein
MSDFEIAFARDIKVFYPSSPAINKREAKLVIDSPLFSIEVLNLEKSNVPVSGFKAAYRLDCNFIAAIEASLISLVK